MKKDHQIYQLLLIPITAAKVTDILLLFRFLICYKLLREEGSNTALVVKIFFIGILTLVSKYTFNIFDFIND